MKQFKVKIGSHIDEHGIEYKAGDVVHSNRDLDKSFREKFEKVSENSPTFVQQTPPAEARKSKEPEKEDTGDTGDDENDGEEQGNDLSAYGDDVSSSFSTAKKVELKVFKKGAKYNVVDPDDSEEPLNEEPLKKLEVTAFLKTYLSK